MEAILEKISQLISKPVISIFDGTLEGYIKYALVDDKLKKLTWLCIFDDETEDEKIFSTKCITNFCNNAIMIKNNIDVYHIDQMDLQDINPIGYKIFKTNGEDCGKICDYDFDDKFNLQNIYLSNENIFDKTQLLKIGKNIIIQKNQTNEKLFYYGPRQIKDIRTEKETLVTIQNSNNGKNIPSKILTSGYGFLIGRKVGQNIYAENGTMLAKKQSVITAQIIDAASKNGKLNELTKYSLA